MTSKGISPLQKFGHWCLGTYATKRAGVLWQTADHYLRVYPQLKLHSLKNKVRFVGPRHHTRSQKQPQCHQKMHCFSRLQEKARSSQDNKNERSAKELAAESAKVKLAQTSETLKHTRENYDKGDETPLHFFLYLNLISVSFFLKNCQFRSIDINLKKSSYLQRFYH